MTFMVDLAIISGCIGITTAAWKAIAKLVEFNTRLIRIEFRQEEMAKTLQKLTGG